MNPNVAVYLKNAYTFNIQKFKVSPARRLKNLLKPVFKFIFKAKAQRNAKRNSYIASVEKDCELECLNSGLDNMANEELENRLLEEVLCSEEGNAIIVCNGSDSGQLQMVDKENFYVPVHFARTDNGTFFWTSVERDCVEPHKIEWHFLDRWTQA
uniref:Enhancer of split malpha protein n=1 Tax=Glossina brevipalpis TaxID=37001 RepID=A0A1A9WRJ3_9MUSC